MLAETKHAIGEIYFQDPTFNRALHDRGASVGDEEIKRAMLGRLLYYLV